MKGTPVVSRGDTAYLLTIKKNGRRFAQQVYLEIEAADKAAEYYKRDFAHARIESKIEAKTLL